MLCFIIDNLLTYAITFFAYFVDTNVLFPIKGINDGSASEMDLYRIVASGWCYYLFYLLCSVKYFQTNFRVVYRLIYEEIKRSLFQMRSRQ